MNKRGFLGVVLIVIAVLAFLIASGYVYFSFLRGGVELSTGKVTVNLQYNSSGDQLNPDQTNQNTDNKTNSTNTTEKNENNPEIVIKEID